MHNIGESPAYSTTLYDLLPNQADGGTCDAAPAQFTAQVFEADGSTPVSPVLAEGSDYTVTFLGDPDCNLTINMLTGAAAIGADQRLIISYEATLDIDSQEAREPDQYRRRDRVVQHRRERPGRTELRAHLHARHYRRHACNT